MVVHDLGAVSIQWSFSSCFWEPQSRSPFLSSNTKACTKSCSAKRKCRLNISKTSFKNTPTPSIYKPNLLLHAEEILEFLRPGSWSRSIDTTSTVVLRRCWTLDNQRVRARRNVKPINDTRTIFRRVHEVSTHGVSSAPEITASDVAKIPKSLPRMGIHTPSCQDCV